jgi:hypothetical protein
MVAFRITTRPHAAPSTAEGWLMQFARLLTERLARPRYLYPGELSSHLLRDIGLIDGRVPGLRSQIDVLNQLLGNR